MIAAGAPVIRVQFQGAVKRGPCFRSPPEVVEGIAKVEMGGGVFGIDLQCPSVRRLGPSQIAGAAECGTEIGPGLGQVPVRLDSLAGDKGRIAAPPQQFEHR